MEKMSMASRQTLCRTYQKSFVIVYYLKTLSTRPNINSTILLS